MLALLVCVVVCGLILLIAYVTWADAQLSFPSFLGCYHQEIRSDTVTIYQEIPFQKKYTVEYTMAAFSDNEVDVKISYNCKVLGKNKVVDGAAFSIKIELLHNMYDSKMNSSDITNADNALRLFSDEDAQAFKALFSNLERIIEKHGNQIDKDRVQMLQDYDIRKTLISAFKKMTERKRILLI